MSISLELLREVPFFSGVSDREVRRLATAMHERHVPAGEDAVRQGTGGIAFFVVLEGEAVVVSDGVERGVLRPGDHFGEMALIVPDLPRTASVVARTDLRLASLTAWVFKPFVRDHPDVAWTLLETMARRVAGAVPQEA